MSLRRRLCRSEFLVLLLKYFFKAGFSSYSPFLTGRGGGGGHFKRLANNSHMYIFILGIGIRSLIFVDGVSNFQ